MDNHIEKQETKDYFQDWINKVNAETFSIEFAGEVFTFKKYGELPMLSALKGDKMRIIETMFAKNCISPQVSFDIIKQMPGAFKQRFFIEFSQYNDLKSLMGHKSEEVEAPKESGEE